MREAPTSPRTAQTPASSVVTCRQGGRVTHGARRARWRCDSLDARPAAVWSGPAAAVSWDRAAVAGVGCSRGWVCVPAVARVAAPVGTPRPPMPTWPADQRMQPGLAGSSATLPPQAAGVRGLQESWPARRPLVGRGQRRQARQSCRRAGRGGGRARPSWPDAPAPGTACSRSAAGRRATSRRLGAGVTWQLGTFPAPAIEPAPQTPQASQEPHSWPSQDHRCPPLLLPTTGG